MSSNIGEWQPALTLEEMAGELERHPDYRVIRRFAPKTGYAKADGRTLLKGVVVDTETTGTCQDTDKLVELGIVTFEFNQETGQVYRVLDSYNSFDDPGMPIPSEATTVHGITDDMVAGKTIDEARVAELLAAAAIVVAHNARFDRPFLEARMPVFENVPWACSLLQVNWMEEGLGSRKLDYIAYQYGFFYEAHRAEADCRALLEALQHNLPISGVKGLKRLVDVYHSEDYRVWVRGSRFDTKDMLKQRAYHWDAAQKCWHKTIGKTALTSEIEWLKVAIFGGHPATVDVEELDAYCRFSARAGRIVSMPI